MTLKCRQWRLDESHTSIEVVLHRLRSYHDITHRQRIVQPPACAGAHDNTDAVEIVDEVLSLHSELRLPQSALRQDYLATVVLPRSQSPDGTVHAAMPELG